MSGDVEVRLADVGEGLDEGEVVRWLVAVGEAVRRDQPLAEVQTDKAVVEVPSPVDGVVAALHADAGAVVPVGNLLVTLRTGPAADPPARPKASPALRRRAAERGIDLAAVVGSGPGGRILDADLDGPSPSPAANPVAATPPARPEAFRGVRRATAVAMARSWATIPHLGAMDELDATELLAARRRLQEAAGEPITLTALLAASVARALPRHPVCNAAVHDDGRGATVHEDVHLGIACATAEGLVVPIVRHADRLGLLALAREVSRLTAAARERRLAPADLAGGTCTVTNYGPLGGRFAAPVVRPGESLIFGFGAVAERPWVVDGAVAVRPVLPWSLSADHRIVDGADALAFAADVAGALRDPIRLLL